MIKKKNIITAALANARKKRPIAPPVNTLPVRPPITSMPVAPPQPAYADKKTAYDRFWNEQLSNMGADNPYMKQYTKYRDEGFDPRTVMARPDSLNGGKQSVPDYLQQHQGNIYELQPGFDKKTPPVLPPNTSVGMGGDPIYRLGGGGGPVDMGKRYMDTIGGPIKDSSSALQGLLQRGNQPPMSSDDLKMQAFKKFAAGRPGLGQYGNYGGKASPNNGRGV